MKNSKKVFLILFLISIIFLSGCSAYNLNSFILPDDTDFINTIKILNTPGKIGSYMWLNFVYEYHPYKAITPYQLYLYKKGDCDDFSNFATYMAYCNGYEVWQIIIKYKNCNIYHSLGIYKEGNFYTYTSNRSYTINKYNNFKELVNSFCMSNNKVLQDYEVYNYENNLIEKVQK